MTVALLVAVSALAVLLVVGAVVLFRRHAGGGRRGADGDDTYLEEGDGGQDREALEPSTPPALEIGTGPARAIAAQHVAAAYREAARPGSAAETAQTGGSGTGSSETESSETLAMGEIGTGDVTGASGSGSWLDARSGPSSGATLDLRSTRVPSVGPGQEDTPAERAIVETVSRSSATVVRRFHGLRPTFPLGSSAGPLTLSFGAVSRAGERGHNQDYFLVGDGVAAVADGVGGLEKGDVASALALSTIVGRRPQHAEDKSTALIEAVRAANKAVRGEARRWLASPGMATTTDVVVFDLQAGRPAMTFVHVGDGTIWYCPAGNSPRALTEPHAILDGPLLLAVGQGEHLVPECNQIPVRPGDRIVLSTDGLTSAAGHRLIIDELVTLADVPAQEAAARLVSLAVETGTSDDTTVVVVDVLAASSAH